MKKLLLASVAFITVAATMAFTTIKAVDGKYTVDAKQSKIEFNGSKKGGYHPGYFPVKSGSVNVADGKITSGSFTIDMAGIKITDGAGAALEGHLKKPDFFDADKFSEAQFDITNVTYKDANNATVEGGLTIKGVRFNQKFDAKVRDVNDKNLFAEAFFSLDRTTIGLAYGVPNISADVQIAIHIFATK